MKLFTVKPLTLIEKGGIILLYSEEIDIVYDGNAGPRLMSLDVTQSQPNWYRNYGLIVNWEIQ